MARTSDPHAATVKAWKEVILMAGTKLRISKVTKHSDWIEVTATQVN
jgi:hypothetical protein